jgi:peptidoglycan/xylan/chitin deacetylase (PgdA/CDA1 family)
MEDSTPSSPSMLPRAVFVISIDTELAWSAVHHDRLDPELLTRERATAEREIVGHLLDLFARRDISATWAIVGHLFLSECNRNGLAHPSIRRPEYEWLDRDWFARDPGTDIESDPMWYGSDLVDAIRTAEPHQEIASHSFSHLIVGEPGCGEGAFEDDLAACHAAAAGHGLELRSFVFPRNAIGHLDVLADAGFAAYRGLRPIPFEGKGPLARAVAMSVDKLSPRPGSAVFPQKVDRLWDLPATNLFAPLDRLLGMPSGLWVSQQVKRLRHAARHKSLYHLWFHPHNLVADPSLALEALDSILEAVSALRDRGLIENLTMSELVDTLEGTR